MSDVSGCIEGVLTNELLIHNAFLEMRPFLKEAICRIAKESGNSKWREWYIRGSDEHVRPQLESYAGLSKCEFIKAQDDYGCLKILRKISGDQAKHLDSQINSYHSNRKSNLEHTRLSSSKSDEDKKDSFSQISELSNSLMGVRSLYAHSKGDGCSYSEAVSGLDLMIGLCDAMGLDPKVREKAVQYRNILPDPTRNQRLTFRIYSNGEDITASQPAEDIVEEMDRSTESRFEIKSEGITVYPGSLKITLEMFYDLLKDIDGIDYRENIQQKEVIEASPETSLRVVAGPGSGKTAVLSFHVLKAVLVDGIDPSSMIVTTFTRKAAKEIRDRIVTKGEHIRDRILNLPDVLIDEKDRIRDVDFNDITIGTLDSIVYEVLSEDDSADGRPAVLAEDFVTNNILRKIVVSRSESELEALGNELDMYSLSPKKGESLIDSVTEYCASLSSRINESSVALEAIRSSIPLTVGIIEQYRQKLADMALLDFSVVESDFLEYLKKEDSGQFTSGLRMLLVDEYQDTNILQEEIYLTLAQKIVKNGGSIKVVGDDDQSLYRFRGSKVKLFTGLEERAKPYGIVFETKFLTTNYRSTEEIIDFCNGFLHLDEEYYNSRADKPKISYPGGKTDSVPVFAIFDDSEERIAKYLVKIFERYVSGEEVEISCKSGRKYVFSKGSDSVNSDFVYLSSSPKERGKKNPALPDFLHRYLDQADGLKLCNPRGVPFREIGYLSELGALLMMCIDPEREVLDRLDKMKTVSFEDMAALNRLDSRAEDLEYDLDQYPKELGDYLESWKAGTVYSGQEWKNGIPVVRIIYDLMYLLGEKTSDPENMIYAESLLRTADQYTQVHGNAAKIIKNSKGTATAKSVMTVFLDVLAPVFRGQVSLDEDRLYRGNMKDRFSIMSIHQSKGLEFPIVVVDVAINKFSPVYRDYERFETKVDETYHMDSILKPQFRDKGLDVGDENDRYDELVRKCYVAFSRAQQVLILVGPESPEKRALNIGEEDEFRESDPEGFPKVEEIEVIL